MFIDKNHRLIGIGGKTLLSHIVLALSVMVIALALSYVTTLSFIQRMRIDDLMSKAQQIAQSGSGIPPSTKTMYLYQELLQARMFFVAKEDGKLRLWRYQEHSGDNAKQEDIILSMDILSMIDQEFINPILNGESISARREFDFTEGEVLFVGVPVKGESGTLQAGIIVAQPVEHLHRLTRTIGYILLATTGFSLILATLIAMLLTRMLVNPIRRLTEAAHKMSDGTYADPIYPLPDDEIGDLGQTMNIMSRKLIDMIRNLGKERDKLNLVISSIGEGLIAVDTDWNIVHSNAAFLELMELDSPSDLWDSQVKSAVALREMLISCMQTGEAQRLSWNNPSDRALSASASAISSDSGERLGTVCLLRDTSEAMRMEQLRKEYVANISHELRTPLTGIRGMVEPLIDGCMDTEEERQECYQIILKETIRLEKLVSEMLDMSRLQDGRVSVELEPLELSGILKSSAQSMKRIAEGSGVELCVETDGSRLSCMGNEARISQVLIILMDNALSFTPAGGRVTVFGRDAGDHIEIGVKDTGCGIEPKDLPFIWERFYKADRSRMRTTGTGLGLAIAKLIVELMGGEIGVVSSPGKGAEFTFTLLKQVPQKEE